MTSIPPLTSSANAIENADYDRRFVGTVYSYECLPNHFFLVDAVSDSSVKTGQIRYLFVNSMLFFI